MAFGVSSSAAKGRREAVHYRDSRALLAEAGLTPHTVLLISKPHTERRPYATTRLVWPEVEPVCTSERLKFEAYIESIGDARLVLDMFVGDLQRVNVYPKQGFAIEQGVPGPIRDACRLLNPSSGGRGSPGVHSLIPRGVQPGSTAMS